MSNKLNGDAGELEVVGLVPCPNCGKKLMLLPPSYPLVDVQCTYCQFKAQVKTNQSKPKAEIFGAGWEIMEKALKIGLVIPPLFANFKWTDKDIDRQEIRLYALIPRKNLKMRVLSESSRRPGYKMFNYVGLDKLPFVISYSK